AGGPEEVLEDGLGPPQMLSVHALGQPVVELPGPGPVARKEARPEAPVLEDAVGIAVVGDLEQASLDAAADHTAGVRELERVRHDGTVVFDPAGGDAHGHARAGAGEPLEHRLPVRA